MPPLTISGARRGLSDADQVPGWLETQHDGTTVDSDGSLYWAIDKLVAAQGHLQRQAPVKLPGAYKATDIGVLITTYWLADKLCDPGPAVFSG